MIRNIEKTFEKQIEENLPEGSVNCHRTMVKPKGEEVIKSWLGHQVYLSLEFFCLHAQQ